MRQRLAHGADRWALILAGGEGSRLRSLTRRITGQECPKQFCSIIGPQSLLAQAQRRARLVVDPARTLLVLTRAHEPFYAPLIRNARTDTILVQPVGRGTAPAILYGLLRIAAVSPASAVVILPSDHYVSDEARFMAHVATAFSALERHPALVVLLGIEPGTAETEYGWIEPGDEMPHRALRSVRRFWEKPTPSAAAHLSTRGGLWNSFVIVAHVARLRDLMRRALPALDEAFRPVQAAVGTAREAAAADGVYAELPALDFSDHVLAPNPADLAVLPVTGVRWTDLGQPRRVFAVLRALGLRPPWATEHAESA